MGALVVQIEIDLRWYVFMVVGLNLDTHKESCYKLLSVSIKVVIESHPNSNSTKIFVFEFISINIRITQTRLMVGNEGRSHSQILGTFFLHFQTFD